MNVAVKATVKDKRAEGTRVVAFLIDNEVEFEFPEAAELLADMLLENDEPPECGADKLGVVKSYKLGYASFGDPNRPHIVQARVDGKVLTAPISGQMLITLSKKAIEAAARRKP
jgi:hypothetical protein